MKEENEKSGAKKGKSQDINVQKTDAKHI
jgi:hypothetical protein